MGMNRSVLTCALGFVLACGGEATPTDQTPLGLKDVRVAIPAADPSIIDLVTPEVEIAPGAEKLYCMYLSYDGDADTAIRTMEGLQGEAGHHVVLLTTREPKPVGSFTDCTDVEEMKAFDPFILPGIELPAKHGIHLGRGTQFVLQFHYVNTFPQPILVRDVARLHKIPVADVETWVAPFVTNSWTLDIPKTVEPHEFSFDCNLPFDIDLLLVGGHLHEQGKAFEVEIGADVNSLSSAYLVDPWKPSFRDAPPISLFFSDPMELTQGTVIRTTCTWENETGRVLDFPEEMCSSFGYVAGRKDPYVCNAM